MKGQNVKYHTEQAPEVQIFSTFEAVSNLSRPSEKLSVLQQAYSQHPKVFKEIVYLVYSKEKFNIGENLLKNVPIGTRYETTFQKFKKLAINAQQRKLTGNALKQALNEFFSKCDPFTAKWYKRILLKDLRIGVGYELISRLFSEKEKIRSFARPMKATLVSDISEKLLEKLFSTGKWEMEPKFDGFRCFATITETEFKLFSYRGTRMPYLEDVLLDDLSKIKSVVGKLPITIDGEIASKDWNQSMAFTPNRKNKLSKSEEEAVRFYAYDLLHVDPTEIPRKSTIVIPLSQRKSELKEILKKAKTFHFVYVPGMLLTKDTLNTDYLSSKAIKYVNKGKLFDGIIIKQTQSPYEFDKRSKWWIKFKKFETLDLLCVGVIPSEKRPGEIAAIEVLYKGKKVKAGGFKEQEAKRFYEHPEEIIGKIVEIKFMSVTKDGSLRHPNFVRIRYDKDQPDA